MPKHWYAVYTKSRAEKMVDKLLNEKGIDRYLPLQRVLRQWSDRKKWVEEPLIRSYIFVNIANDREYLNVLQTDGVVKFVTFAGKAAKIPEKQIDNIKLLLASEEDLEVTPEKFEPGMDIEVHAGPLKGLEGSLIELKGKNRVKVELEAIGQSILVEIPAVYLRKK
ncbi:MAG: UpxY family transcription antiterminator [Bacteroidales bacterium]|nr:UpxY family transcription antiterminator [Bacteroidales bacterium]MCF8387739.1 UpxY family transcription antiterminator [Bacteroidales bacterium]MCF8397555.1 UpxY family transcription antiterminator [Bacteroidales bacterium]